MAIDWEKTFRDAIAAYNRGDWEALGPLMTEDAELQRAPTAPEAEGIVSGRAAVVEFFKPDVLTDQRLEVEEFHLAEGCFWARLVFNATGSGSGLQVALTAWSVYRYNGEKLTRIEIYDDEAQARAAAGV